MLYGQSMEADGNGNGYGIGGKIFSLDGAVKESAPTGTAVGKVDVYDPDLGESHTFELVNNAGWALCH